MSFRAKFVAGNTFRSILEVLKAHISEGNFVCTPEGMSFSSMDATHISLAKMWIPNGDFAEYECSESINFGISLVHLTLVLKSISAAGNEITIQMKRGMDVVDVVATAADTGRVVSQYCVHLMDIGNEEYNIPAKPGSVSAMISSSDLKSLLGNLEHVGDIITLKMTQEGLAFSSSGILGHGQHNLSVANGECKMQIAEGTEFTDRYSAFQLRNFAKSAAFSAQVIMKVSRESPLKLTYRIFENGRLEFYLAPLAEEAQQ